MGKLRAWKENTFKFPLLRITCCLTLINSTELIRRIYAISRSCWSPPSPCPELHLYNPALCLHSLSIRWSHKAPCLLHQPALHLQSQGGIHPTSLSCLLFRHQSVLQLISVGLCMPLCTTSAYPTWRMRKIIGRSQSWLSSHEDPPSPLLASK